MLRKIGTAAAALTLVAGSMLIASSANAAPACTTVGIEVTCTFAYSGATESWTVPAGVTEVTASVVGARGGSVVDFTYGGLGGKATADLFVSSGDTLFIAVGGEGGSTGGCGSPLGMGGFNGGAPGGTGVSGCAAPGGGGASDIRIGGTDLTSRVLVAGGGGGSANIISREGPANGGAGGDVIGQNGGPGGIGGAGGDQVGGGSGLLGYGSSTLSGGGGGGYYGGAGGTYPHLPLDAAGGGGSGYGPTGTVFETGVGNGHGQVTISYQMPATTITVTVFPASATFGSPVDLNALIASDAPGADLSGTVEFFVDGTSAGISTVTASSGIATLSAVNLAEGTHMITAVYSGNGVTNGSTTATPATLTVTPATVTPPPITPTPTAPTPPVKVNTSAA